MLGLHGAPCHPQEVLTQGVETVNSQLTFDPMWSPEMMSPAAKLFFGR